MGAVFCVVNIIFDVSQDITIDSNQLGVDGME
jgi:hypothetical protein